MSQDPQKMQFWNTKLEATYVSTKYSIINNLILQITANCNKLIDLSTHTHTFNGRFSGTTRVGQYQKGKTNLDFTEARDSERQWHQQGNMQVCTSLQIDNHARTSPFSFLQGGCPSCHPTKSVKALKALVVLLKSYCTATNKTVIQKKTKIEKTNFIYLC